MRVKAGLVVRPMVRLSIGQPLSFNALERLGRALEVADVKRHALVVPEINLTHYPVLGSHTGTC